MKPRRKGKRKPDLRRLHNMDDERRLTRIEAADIMRCSAATIGVHNRAGILNYTPTSPVTIKVRDLKAYAAILANGHAREIRRTIGIKGEDCPTYSRSGIFVDGRSHDSLASELSSFTQAMHQKYAREKRNG